MNLSEELIKALSEKIFQEFGVTQEDGKVLRELFSLYYFKIGHFSDWLIQVESHADALLDKINQTRGEKLAQWRAQFIQWCSMAGAFATTLKKTKAQKLYQQGIHYAEAFLAQGETAEAVRKQVLNLYFSAGVLQGQAPFNDAAQAIQLWQRGLEHAETFLAQGETAPKVREQLLELYGITGFLQEQTPFNDVAQAFEYYQRGLEHAEMFLAQGETASKVREWVLQLYINAANAQKQAPFNDVTQAFEFYQRGINHAEIFLAQRETAWAVRGRVLELYFNAGVLLAKAPFNDAAQAVEFYQCGVNHAEAFLAQREKTSAVRGWALKLYFNAGKIHRDAPFNDAVQAFDFYQRGIKHAEAFLVQGEKTSAVRELVINLYFNAGALQKQAPFNDAVQAFEFYQRGVNHTEAFLAQGEKASAVREQVLNLYVNAGVLQSQAPFNNATQAFEYYQRGIKHAEAFLTQGETASPVREQVLNLYTNAGVLQKQAPFNDATQAFEYYQHGIKHAEAFLTQQGETASPVRERALTLYVNAGVLQKQAPFNDATQAFNLWQCGLEHANAFLTQGETTSGLRDSVLKLYLNMGFTQGQAPFNDTAQAVEFYRRGIEHAEAFLAQGERTAEVRDGVLGLYHSAGLMQGQVPFTDILQEYQYCVQEYQYYQRGLEHAEAFLAQGETVAGVRNTVLKLYNDAGMAQKKAPFNDIVQAFKLCQRGLEHAEAFLAQGEIASGVRETVLSLYNHIGAIQNQAPFDDAGQTVEYYQRGLKQADAFLAQGETASKVREQILELYDALISKWDTSRKIGTKIPYLPLLGLYSWDSLAKSPSKQKILGNWRPYLNTSISPAGSTRLFSAFQAFLHRFLSIWHNPQQPHRHFVGTETLLAISESVYGLEQAKENQRLQTVYQCLQAVQNSPMVQEARELPLQKQALEQESQPFWQKLGKQPEVLDDLATLRKLSWWKKVRHWRTVSQLRENIRASLQLTFYHLAKSSHWQQAVKRTEKALFDWLYTAIDKQFNLANGLEELPDIVLGILLANSSQGELLESKAELLESKASALATVSKAEALDSTRPNKIDSVLETWQHTPCWQNAESLQAALAGSGWQTWAKTKNSSLYLWLNLLGTHPTTKRLTIANEIANFEQPHLQKWLRELREGKAENLSTKLPEAWETAQQQANRLAQLLTALTEPNDQSFQRDWFAERQVKPEIYLKTLAAVILGDASKPIAQALRDWLYQQGQFDETTPVLDTLNTLKRRFDCAVSVYKPSYLRLEATVQDWAKVLLAEKRLDFENREDLETLWNILERARIGLAGSTITLPDNCEETYGKELWVALVTSISLIETGYDIKGEMWLPFQLWLERSNDWLLKPPTVVTCQQHLLPQEALVQPFLDPVLQRFRVLWLDKKGLALKDLSDDCALEPVWLEKGDMQWTGGLTAWKPELKHEGVGSTEQNGETVMESVPVRLLAETLSEWATGFSQLTVIFPMPLKQLPWENLPQLERFLVPEISLAHWLHTPSTLSI